jgi:hypothetical protein
MPKISASYPSPRGGHGLAYDPVLDRTVLVGGSGVNLGGTWQWNGTVWTDMGSPFGIDHEVSAVFDSLHGGVLAHSRSAGGMQSNTRLWLGGSWVTSPASLDILYPRLAFDVMRLRTVAQGGYSVPQNPAPNFVSGSTYEYGYAPRPASATPFGVGCGAPPLGLAAGVNANPRIGMTFRTEITNVPFGFPFVAFGSNDQFFGPFPLPLVLDGFGYLGCLLHHDAFLSVPCTQQTSPTTAAYDLAIPNVPALLTSTLYLQAWSLAPGVNAGGTVLSNGLRIVIGNS